MPFEHKPNRGSLFKNDRKEKDTHPDYKGSALIDGKHYWLSAWVETSDSGIKYFSMSYKEKDEQPAAATTEPTTDDDGFRTDGLPF